MVYAIFMLLVLATLAATWLRHALQLPLFIVTLAWMLAQGFIFIETERRHHIGEVLRAAAGCR